MRYGFVVIIVTFAPHLLTESCTYAIMLSIMSDSVRNINDVVAVLRAADRIIMVSPSHNLCGDIVLMLSSADAKLMADMLDNHRETD